MKIGLLAPEFSGKTSYLVALYAVLVQDLSSDGKFPFRYSVVDPAQRRWLNDQFGYLVDESLPLQGTGAHRFPVKTGEDVTLYQLSVTEKTTSFSEKVSLIDFPGEVIRGVGTDALSSLYNKTMSDLADSDAFIVLLDATSLLGQPIYKTKHRISPTDIEDIVRKAIDAFGTKNSVVGVPVAFCVSKADKIGALYAGDAGIRDSTFERVMELFPSFFEERHHHPVMLSCVSLGENIEKAPDRKEGMGGPFEPFFIEKPFEFCLSFGALSSMTNKSRDADRFRDLARTEDAKADRAREKGLLGQVGEWFTTGAEFGEWPDDYWKRQSDLSLRVASRSDEEADKYKNLISLYLDRLREPETAAHYSLYFGGKRHVISRYIVLGKLPLEPVG